MTGFDFPSEGGSGGSDPVAQAAAAAAQGDATQALADAATADAKAVASKADAVQALGDAATADGKAVAAQTAATQAQAEVDAVEVDVANLQTSQTAQDASIASETAARVAHEAAIAPGAHTPVQGAAPDGSVLSVAAGVLSWIQVSVLGTYRGSAATFAALPTAGAANSDWAILNTADGGNPPGIYVYDGGVYALGIVIANPTVLAVVEATNPLSTVPGLVTGQLLAQVLDAKLVPQAIAEDADAPDTDAYLWSAERVRQAILGRNHHDHSGGPYFSVDIFTLNSRVNEAQFLFVPYDSARTFGVTMNSGYYIDNESDGSRTLDDGSVITATAGQVWAFWKTANPNRFKCQLVSEPTSTDAGISPWQANEAGLVPGETARIAAAHPVDPVTFPGERIMIRSAGAGSTAGAVLDAAEFADWTDVGGYVPPASQPVVFAADGDTLVANRHSVLPQGAAVALPVAPDGSEIAWSLAPGAASATIDGVTYSDDLAVRYATRQAGAWVIHPNAPIPTPTASSTYNWINTGAGSIYTSAPGLPEYELRMSSTGSRQIRLRNAATTSRMYICDTVARKAAGDFYGTGGTSTFVLDPGENNITAGVDYSFPTAGDAEICRVQVYEFQTADNLDFPVHIETLEITAKVGSSYINNEFRITVIPA